MGIFLDILVILGIATVVLLIGLKLRLPLIIGFLITGVLAGPHGFGIIGASEEINILAEIGVVLLLFTIGVELSLKSLLQMRRMFIFGGLSQVVITTLIIGSILKATGLAWAEAATIAFCVSLSSTAIVLRQLQTRREIDAPHGRIAVSILVFQDLVSVPALLLIPLLAATNNGSGLSIGTMLLQAVAMLGIVWVGARWIIPRLFTLIAGTRNRELFLISVVVLCFGVALLASKLGLSVALGAFLAGLIISESEYNYQVLGNITPFRDLFTSFFFVAIGLLLDLNYIAENPLTVVGLTVALIVLKSVVISLCCTLFGYPVRTAVLSGMSLAQTGEFAFIVCGAAVASQVVSGNSYQTFLAVSALSMAATPLLISVAPKLANRLSRLGPLKNTNQSTSLEPETRAQLSEHLIIIGFGVNGTNVARASKNAGIPYVIVEMNPDTIKRAKEDGEPIYLGDASLEAIWETVEVEKAKIAVIAISDLEATRKAVSLAHRMNPNLTIVARTRYLNEIETLLRLGAREVVPEEFETSVEIFSRVLRYYLIPMSEIDDIIQQIRAENYQMLRMTGHTSGGGLLDLESALGDMRASTVRIGSQTPIVGRSLAELQLRANHGVTVLMIKRGDSVISNPEADQPLLIDDLIVLYGENQRLKEVIEQFKLN